jgi:hypothetical protein
VVEARTVTVELSDQDADILLDALFEFQARMRSVRPRTSAAADRLRQRLLRQQLELYWGREPAEGDWTLHPEST